MLIVPARKLGNPIVALVEMKAGDALVHDIRGNYANPVLVREAILKTSDAPRRQRALRGDTYIRRDYI